MPKEIVELFVTIFIAALTVIVVVVYFFIILPDIKRKRKDWEDEIFAIPYAVGSTYSTIIRRFNHPYSKIIITAHNGMQAAYLT